MDTLNYMKLRSRVVPLSPAKRRAEKRKSHFVSPKGVQASKKLKGNKATGKLTLSEEDSDGDVIFVSNSRDPLEYIDLTVSSQSLRYLDLTGRADQY